MSIAGGPAHRLALISRGRWRRPALALVLFLLIALALPAIASSQIDETGTEGASVPTSIPGPEAFAALGAGQSPEPLSTEAERDESATAHTDLSSGEALALLGQEFEEALVAQPIPELDLSGGRSVERYLDPNSALIDVPESAADLMVEGTSPLRAPENGTPAPLDGDLVVEGDHFEPSNAPVEAELPAELPDGVAFDELGVEVVPVTSEPVGAVPIEDKLFYPNFSDAAADTDVLITPTSNGADVSFQLRSQESPERLALEFSMPEGATLETTADGGAAVSAADGTGLLTVAPAFAWDAESTPVSVSYEVVDDQLELSVAHQDRDLLYPLIVDPLVEHDLLDKASGRDPLWNWYSSQPGFTWSHEPDGLQSAARALHSYPNAYDNAQWVLSALRDSTIEQITYQSFFRYNGAPPACMTIGLWSRVTNWWEPGTVVDAWGNQVGAGGGAAQEICGSADYDWRDVWVGPNRSVGDTPASNRNMAVFSLFTPPCCTGGRLETAYHRLNEVWVYRHDYEAPSATFQSKPPSGWRDDGNTVQNLTAFGVDEGLGIKRFELSGPGINPLTGGDVITATHPCSGQRGSRCPGYEGWSRNIDFKLREGRSPLTLDSYDIIGHRGRQGHTQRIDRSRPVVETPSGTLYTSRADIVQELSYKLNPFITDGSKSSTSQMRSGVEKVEYFVGGEQSPRYTFEQACTDPDGSCAFNPEVTPGATWATRPATESFPGEFEEGTHTIRIVATDALDHTSPRDSQKFNITVRSDDEEPELGFQTGPPAADGSRELNITSSDGQPIGAPPGAVGSGVEDLEVYVDGQQIQSFHQECPDGGCPMNRTMRLSATQAPNNHEIVVTAGDGAGAEALRLGGQKRTRYQHFGYNEEFVRPQGVREEEVAAAIDGGARLLRTAVDWCDIAEDSHPGLVREDPTTWDWSAYDAFFNQLSERNVQDGDPDPEFKVIAAAVGSPPWANGPEDSCGQQGIHAFPPDDPAFVAGPAPDGPGPEIEGTWRGFVGELVNRYKDQSEGLIAVEAWNEPNLNVFWGQSEDTNLHPEPQRFARLVNVASSQVESIAPGIQVLPGGLSPTGVAPNQFMMDATDPQKERINPNLIDALSFHLYAFDTSQEKIKNDRDAREQIREYYDRLTNGLRDAYEGKARWITEIGFPSQSSDDLERASIRNQRRRLMRAYFRFANLPLDPGEPGLASFLAYRLVDRPVTEPTRFGVLLEEAGLPPKAPSGEPARRPVYCELAAWVHRSSDPVDPTRC